MSKESKDSFKCELEQATLKEMKEAITWHLMDVQKSSENIAESVGDCSNTFCHKEVLKSVAADLRDVLSKMQEIEQYLDMVQ